MITFTKVNLPYGCLGNMSPDPVVYEGKRYKTAEALFQALRFQNEEIREAIRTSPSPMTAKMIAKRYKAQMVVVPQGPEDLGNMRLVLRLKMAQSKEARRILLVTKDDEIVEDCSKRPGGSGTFWGKALIDGLWQGQNWLGKLLMEVRTEIRAAGS